MTPEYYKEYYDLERSNWWFTARLEILKSQIEIMFPHKNDLNILNIGVATGATSQMLEMFGKVKSIEYDEVCFNFVKEKLQIDIEQGTILDLQFAENSFDLVCAFDVVEHVQNDQLAVKEMIRVCKSSGFVFVTVPAFMDLWSKHDEINYHFKRYTSKTLLPLFNSNTGNVIYHSYFNTILFLPIYLVRWISNKFPKLFKRDGSGSDHSMFELGFLNKVLYLIFYAENILLKKLIKLPFGVSFMLSFKKK
jgi:ubiquinone/menaquinone biosynthesis C-methylase UbiE